MRKELKRALTRAKVQLVIQHPFFGTLASHLPNYEDTNIPTACTDGKSIRWNPDFALGLKPEELRAVIIHEIMHVSNGHTWRRNNRNPVKWNIACDLAINHLIKQEGHTLPAGALMPSGDLVGISAEEIYAKLPDSLATSPPSCGEVGDTPPNEATELEGEWKSNMVSAAQAAKSAGKLPKGMEHLVHAALYPRVPWRTLLRQFVSMTARNDFNWMSPSRRYMQAGIYMPGMKSEELPDIAIAIDTSGSVIDRAGEFIAEVNEILAQFDTTAHVLYIDAAVHRHDIFKRSDLPIPTLNIPGGGGTSFCPAFDWLEREDMTPACLIYLTDGYGSYPDAAPDYPVLWVMTTENTPPFGEIARMGGHE